ncbi:MAG: hypothetical protein ACI87O_002046 [Planctomycetota bacterium]|jgi:hypothetical protein
MILTLAALSFLAPFGTWYVDAAAASPGLGTLTQPYSRIDYALAQPGTIDGDVVWVSPGDYVDESIDFLGKRVRVESLGTATDTWITGLGAGAANPHALVTMTQAEDESSVLRGFTLRNSSGRLGGRGGALYCAGSSPSIEQCRFEDNLGGQLGTAVYLEGGAPAFTNCWFGGNGGDGPLFANSSAITLQGCFFSDSLALPRGDVRMTAGSLLATDCFFDGNGSGSADPGAAMHLMAVGSQVRLARCHMRASAGSNVSGRSLYLESCVTFIEDSSFTDFHPADVPGGGLLAVGGDLSVSNTTFTGCATEFGVGGAIALISCRTILTACAFQGNSSASMEKSGGAVYKWGPENMLVSNCLFDGNEAGEGGAVHVASGPAAFLGSFFLDNKAMTQGGSNPPARGGAIVALGSAFIEDCAFVGNHCTADVPGSNGREALGGAVFLGAPSVVNSSLFHENWASGQTLAFGGGLYSDANGAGSQLSRLQVRRNRSQTGIGGTAQGGGIAGNNTISHCSFIGNEAADGGGSVLGGDLDHCILYGGLPDDIGGLTQVSYSLITNGYPGTSNLAGDPFFWSADDLHLLPGSACIDSGDALAPADLDGTPADMGALPYDAKHCGPGCAGVISSQPCSSLPNSTGVAALTTAYGSQGVQDNLVILVSEYLPLGVPGYYLTAPQGGFVPLFGGSEGNLCVGGGLLRLNSTINFANAAGQVSRILDLTQLPAGTSVMPGSSWHYQLWYRDFNGVQSTSNTTSSAQIDFL